jgi:hypothetical protein
VATAAPKPKPLTTVQPRVIPIAGGAIHVYPNGTRRRVWAHPGWAQAPQAPKPPTAPKAPGAINYGDLGRLIASQRQQQPFAPDSQYIGEAGAATFKMNADLQGLQAQGITDAQTRQTALAQLARQQPVDLQQANVNRNKQGLFYSTTLGNDRANISADYTRRAGDVENTYAAHERARAAAEAGIRAGYSVDDAARMAEAVGRRITSDSDAADNNSLVPNPAPAPKPKAAPAPRVIHTQRQPTTRGRRPRRRK